MRSYFFVPASKLNKIEAINKLGVDEIIIDLEDAVKESDRKAYLNELADKSAYFNYYIRVPLFDFKGEYELSLLKELLKIGYRKFIFPKLNSIKDFEFLLPIIEHETLKIIILIEAPRLFFEAKELLLTYTKYFSGISIGSHDFMSIIGGEHSLKNLEFLRLNVLYLARMVNIEAIDIASMEIKDDENFIAEIMDGHKKGYDAKFFIHPNQLAVLKGIQLYSKAEYDWAVKVISAFEQVASFNEFNPIVIDNQIIERPHINKAKKIIKYFEHETE